MSKILNSIFKKIEKKFIVTGKEYVQNEIKKKIFRIGEISILLIIGILLIAFGIADYIEYKFPIVQNGIGTILFGLILLLIGYMITIKK
jgi:hypothetical protein